MPITVAFVDNSTPGPSGPITAWAWDFGDGGTSTEESPTHDYADAGTYSVSLEVTGTGGDGTDTATISVRVAGPEEIAAAFTDSPSGLSVDFTDTSTAGPSGPITAWAWDFGDGGTSTSQNPSHTYASNGVYTVTLTVTGTGGDGTSTITHDVSAASVSGTVLFDGRASRMSELVGHEVTPPTTYTTGPLTWSDGSGPHYYYLHQTPLIWVSGSNTGLNFIKDNISLQSDARYGKIYKATALIGDSNAWQMIRYLAQGKAAAQIAVGRTLSLGTTDYFAFAVKVNAWTNPAATQWADIISVGYQTAANDQCAIQLAADSGSPTGLSFRIASNAGYGNNSTVNPIGTTRYKDNFKSVVFGRWEEFVVAVKWSTHKDGFVTIYNRVPSGANTWSQIYTKTGIDTQFYGVSPYGTFPQDGDRGVVDKLGIYYGVFPAGTQQTMYESGLCRCSSLDAAKETFPA